MNKIKYNEIVKNKENLLKNTEFIGFDDDYFVIQSLLMDWSPKNVFEIGTCTGNGSRIIRHILPSSNIYTLDINVCGELCPNDVTKLVGDSMSFDYKIYHPIDCWFIDGNHTYENVKHETLKALESNPGYIIYHDADIEEVYQGIIDAFVESDKTDSYNLFQVIEPTYIYSSSKKNITRVAYAIKK